MNFSLASWSDTLLKNKGGQCGWVWLWQWQAWWKSLEIWGVQWWQWCQMRRASGEAPGQAKSCTRMSRLIPKHVTLAATTDEQKGLAPELTTSNNTTTPLHGQYSMSSNVITPHMHILTHHMCSRDMVPMIPAIWSDAFGIHAHPPRHVRLLERDLLQSFQPPAPGNRAKIVSSNFRSSQILAPAKHQVLTFLVCQNLVVRSSLNSATFSNQTSVVPDQRPWSGGMGAWVHRTGRRGGQNARPSRANRSMILAQSESCCNRI